MMASDRPNDQQNLNDDDDDDFDFGGFEAASPEPLAGAVQATAQPSPWSAFALGGNVPERPDLLCAQNRFPPYLDPSDIAGASADSRNVATDNEGATQHPVLAAADLLGDAQFADARLADVSGEINGAPHLNPNGRLPDIGLGIHDGHLFGNQPLVAAAAIPLLDPVPPVRDVSAVFGDIPADEEAVPPEGAVVVENEVVAAAGENNGAALPNAEGDVQQRALNPEDGDRINNAALNQQLETLTTRNQLLEADLASCQSDLESQRIRLQEIETRHQQTLGEVRRGGQDALSVVVEQYKEQLKTCLLQQQELYQQRLIDGLREQMTSFTEMLQQQREKHEEDRNRDKEEMKREVETAVQEARLQEQEKFEAFISEEQQKWKERLELAVKDEREASDREIQRLMSESQKAANERLDEARAEYRASLETDRRNQEEALATVRREEAERAREHLSTIVSEERERGRESVREALEAARADSRMYIDEQRRRDSTIRQRHLASLDLFLESCRQQISFLMSHEHGDDTASLPVRNKFHNHTGPEVQHSDSNCLDSASNGELKNNKS